MPELTVEWRSVAKEPPPAGKTVLVWHRGQIVLARYCPHTPVRGVYEWLLSPPGRTVYAPYLRSQPQWWQPQPEPPSGQAEPLDPFLEVSGESMVRWRGSVGDLYTDLLPLLTLPQLSELGRKLIGQEGGAVSRQPSAVSSEAQKLGSSGSESGQEPRAKSQEPSSPVPMLLRCPHCNERHIDEGEFATKPHHTHACQICGEVWRPAIVNTVGVHFLPGFRNSRAAASEPPGSVERDVLLRVRELIDRVVPDTPTGFSCPVTKAECAEPCVGSECRLLKLRNAP